MPQQHKPRGLFGSEWLNARSGQRTLSQPNMKPGLTPRVQFHITQSSTKAVERKTRQNVEEPVLNEN